MTQVFHSLPAARAALGSCAVTIGKYDGMHLGHQRILTRLKQEAAGAGLATVVILSEPQPEEFFAGDAAPPRLNAFHDKVGFLAGFGIDAVFCLRFDTATSRLPPADFVGEVLVGGLGTKALVVGEDFRFGFQRQGSVATLQQLGQQHGFSVAAVTPCLDAGERISSTLVRQYLERGDCTRVAQCLGRPYSISGKVVKGRQLGRELGFPTANVELCSNKLALSGIFVVTAEHDGVVHKGVASIGYNPTVNTDGYARLEVFVLDYTGDLYDAKLTVSFLHKLRDEAKFPDLVALQQQMQRDVAAASEFFAQARELV